jgi:hypothetical protein
MNTQYSRRRRLLNQAGRRGLFLLYFGFSFVRQPYRLTTLKGTLVRAFALFLNYMSRKPMRNRERRAIIQNKWITNAHGDLLRFLIITTWFTSEGVRFFVSYTLGSFCSTAVRTDRLHLQGLLSVHSLYFFIVSQ